MSDVADYVQQKLLEVGIGWVKDWKEEMQCDAPDVLAKLKLSGKYEEVLNGMDMVYVYYLEAVNSAKHVVSSTNTHHMSSLYPLDFKVESTFLCVKALKCTRDHIENLFILLGKHENEATKIAHEIITEHTDGLLDEHQGLGVEVIRKIKKFVKEQTNG